MHTRICPKCQSVVTHKSKYICKKSEGKNCWKCANINNEEKRKKVSQANKGQPYNKSKLGKKESLETRQKKSNSLKGRTPGFLGKKHRKDTRQQMSQKRAEMLRERFGTSQISPWYNKKACELFDELNKQRNWNGIHAENGGEFYVGGYWLDYYEPVQNIAIEFDEPRHKIPSHAEKDRIKQEYITQLLNCRFYRIDSENPTIDHIN